MPKEVGTVFYILTNPILNVESNLNLIVMTLFSEIVFWRTGSCPKGRDSDTHFVSWCTYINIFLKK